MQAQTPPQTPTCTPPDLDAIAEQLGVSITHRDLKGRWNGLWLPAQRAIILTTGLTPTLERCTLAHELGHATLGHRSSCPKNERQADAWAAGILIPEHEVHRLALETPDPARWAVELGVTTHLMGTWLTHRHRKTA